MTLGTSDEKSKGAKSLRAQTAAFFYFAFAFAFALYIANLETLIFLSSVTAAR